MSEGGVQLIDNFSAEEYPQITQIPNQRREGELGTPLNVLFQMSNLRNLWTCFAQTGVRL